MNDKLTRLFVACLQKCILAGQNLTNYEGVKPLDSQIHKCSQMCSVDIFIDIQPFCCDFKIYFWTPSLVDYGIMRERGDR